MKISWLDIIGRDFGPTCRIGRFYYRCADFSCPFPQSTRAVDVRRQIDRKPPRPTSVCLLQQNAGCRTEVTRAGELWG